MTVERVWMVLFALASVACGQEPPSAAAPEPSERSAPAEQVQAPTPTSPPRAEPPAVEEAEPRAARPTGDLPDCLWFADPREPAETGPRSLPALDALLARELGGETWVLGRVRGRGRGCPDVSIGLAIRRVPHPSDDPEEPFWAPYGEATRILGERGDERRTMPWSPDGPYRHPDGVTCEPPDLSAEVVLFRVAHSTSSTPTHLRTTTLQSGRCRWLHHRLVLGDIDRDGRSEVRVETRTALAETETSEWESGHRVWIVDVATFAIQLEVDLEVQNEAFMGGMGQLNTTADLSFRDVDGDGHRDALTRGRSNGYDSDDESDDMGEFRDHFRHVHRYDPIADVYVRVTEGTP